MNKQAFASHALEIERLSHLLWHYETVNVDQKKLLEHQQKQRDGLIIRIQEMEKFIKGLQKKVNSLEQTIKFEKIATEGIKKRSNTFESELFASQELNTHNVEKAQLFSKHVDEYLLQLQQERCNRLQLIHEKESYIDKYEEALSKLSKVEEDNRKMAEQNLNNLQKLETLLSQNQSASQLLAVQSDEIVRLNNEVEQLRQKLNNSNQSLLHEESNHGKYLRQMDIFHQEISFLRKQLIMHNIPYQHTSASTAASIPSNEFSSVKSTEGGSIKSQLSSTEKSWSGFQPFKSSQENNVTAEANKITAYRYHESEFCQNNLFSNRNREATKPTYNEIMNEKQQMVLAKGRAAKNSASVSNNQSNAYMDDDSTMNRSNSVSSRSLKDDQSERNSASVISSIATTMSSQSIIPKVLSPLATPHRKYRSPFDHGKGIASHGQTIR